MFRYALPRPIESRSSGGDHARSPIQSRPASPLVSRCVCKNSGHRWGWLDSRTTGRPTSIAATYRASARSPPPPHSDGHTAPVRLWSAPVSRPFIRDRYPAIAIEFAPSAAFRSRLPVSSRTHTGPRRARAPLHPPGSRSAFVPCSPIPTSNHRTTAVASV